MGTPASRRGIREGRRRRDGWKEEGSLCMQSRTGHHGQGDRGTGDREKRCRRDRSYFWTLSPQSQHGRGNLSLAEEGGYIFTCPVRFNDRDREATGFFHGAYKRRAEFFTLHRVSGRDETSSEGKGQKKQRRNKRSAQTSRWAHTNSAQSGRDRK